MRAQQEGARPDMNEQRTLIPLKKAIENLIRNEYGRYVVTFNEVMAPGRNGIMLIDPKTYPKDTVDFAPLVFGDGEARNKEIDKMFRLSQHFSEPVFETIARRLQMLVHLDARVDAIFKPKLDALVPPTAAPEKVEQFSALLQDAWAADLRAKLMPDTVGKLVDPRSIIARAERQEAAVGAYLEIVTDPELQRTAGLRLSKMQQEFYDDLRREVGMKSTRGIG